VLEREGHRARKLIFLLYHIKIDCKDEYEKTLMLEKSKGI